MKSFYFIKTIPWEYILRRSLAFIFDMVFLVCIGILLINVSIMFGLSDMNAMTFRISHGILFPLTYLTFFVAKFGITPGKKCWGLKINRSEEYAVGLGRAFLRSLFFFLYLSPVIGQLLIVISLVMIATDPRHRSLSDRLLHTFVVDEYPVSSFRPRRYGILLVAISSMILGTLAFPGIYLAATVIGKDMNISTYLSSSDLNLLAVHSLLFILFPINSILHLCAAIGLLRMRQWGRITAMIGWLIISLLTWFLLLMDIPHHWENLGSEVLLLCCIFATTSLLFLVFLTRPSVKEELAR